MKIHLIKIMFIALAVVGLSSPALAIKVDNPELYKPENVKKNIIIGKTTKEQVKAVYGEPYSMDRSSGKEGNYERSYTYFPEESRAERTRNRVTGFMKGLIPGRAGTATDVAQEQGVGARNVRSFSLRVEFDRNGIVQDYRQDETNNSRNAL